MPPVPKPSLKERAIEELREFLVLATYLYICLGALLLFKGAILEEARINFTAWGGAAIKAMVLAKFMFVGRVLRLGERYKDRALIWPALHKSPAFLVLLLILTTVEEVMVGLLNHRPLAESLTHVVGPTLLQGFATSLVMFLVLIPYFAFRCLGDVLGDRYLVYLFLKDRPDELRGGNARQRVA